jgi:hypothetical protein
MCSSLSKKVQKGILLTAGAVVEPKFTPSETLARALLKRRLKVYGSDYVELHRIHHAIRWGHTVGLEPQELVFSTRVRPQFRLLRQHRQETG